MENRIRVPSLILSGNCGSFLSINVEKTSIYLYVNAQRLVFKCMTAFSQEKRVRSIRKDVWDNIESYEKGERVNVCTSNNQHHVCAFFLYDRSVVGT